MTIANRTGRWAIGRRACAAAGLAGLLTLTGCQSVQNSSPSQTLVRVIDASYDAPGVDVYVASTPIAVDIGAATITNYAYLAPENTTAYVYPTKTKTAGAQVSGEFEVGEQASVFITDTGTGYTASILTDQAVAPPQGQFSIRFLQQALKTGAVDIYLVPSDGTLAGTKPLASNVKPQTVVNYVNVMAGSYTLVITPTGMTTVDTSLQVNFDGGQVRTALIMDAQLTTNPPVTVVVGNDLN